MEYTRSVPDLIWDKIAVREDDLTIGMRADSPIPHRLTIRRAVLEDGLSYSDPDLVRLASENRNTIETAVAKAWGEGREKEIFEIGGPGHFVWLELVTDDFQ
jgi:hypothetical protein